MPCVRRHPDLVAREQRLVLVDAAGNSRTKASSFGQEVLGQVALDAADARVAGREARAADALDQAVDRLALAEGPQEDRHRAQVHGVGAQAEQVRRDARQLAADDADGLRARRRLDAHELLAGHRVGHVVGQRREVVETVGVGQELVEAQRLADLLLAAVQVADDRLAADDLLAVELEDQAQHAVRGRVLRPHVDEHVLGVAVLRDLDVEQAWVGHGAPPGPLGPPAAGGGRLGT
jgi:hypothetical protein